MLAWVMNMGFAASPSGTVSAVSAPFSMGLGDELWLSSLLILFLVRLIA
jgi:hypothetical protein